MLSRLAIGRFIREAVDNMDTAINYTTLSRPRSHDTVSATSSSSGTGSSGSRRARFVSENRENQSEVDSTDDVSSKDKSSMNNLTNITRASSEGPVLEAPALEAVNRVNMMTGPSSSESTKSSSTRRVNTGTKMLIYSGHDSTMVPLLKAIGLYNGNTVHCYCSLVSLS